MRKQAFSAIWLAAGRHSLPTLFFCFLLFFKTWSQAVQDNFSDGNLTENPVWQGDTANFVVNDQSELQLNAPAAGSSRLFLPLQIADSALWELYVRLDFDPSAANRLRIYLQSDDAALQSGSGYFLQVGEDGAADAIRFFRQDAGAAVLLAAGATGSAAVSPEFRLRMTRESGGLWRLMADYAGGFNFVPVLEVADAVYGGGTRYFGWQCVYTSTRKDKFFFDDVLAVPLLPDLSPPVLLKSEPLSATELEVYFDEPLEAVSAAEISNYLLEPDIGEPAGAFPDNVDKTLVHLVFDQPLVSGRDYTLFVQQAADLSGNIAGSQQVAVKYIELGEAEAYDILINEIMADPSPSLALPETEFLELYNRSGKVLDLAGFSLSAGGAPQYFPAYQFFPDSYLLVCDDSAVDSLTAYGEVVGLSSFPALTNGGDEISLTGPAGQLIHFVSYSEAWYKDPLKSEGGWTLELVNPLSPCRGSSNWRASDDLSGGTPGRSNSVVEAVPDLAGPVLTRVFAAAQQPTEIQLFFDEKLDAASAADLSGYMLSPALPLAGATILQGAGDAVRLSLAVPPEAGIAYQLSVSEPVADCLGNPVEVPQRRTFALPDTPAPFDLIINEVLFNPESGGFDFVEIYNRTQKVFSTADLLLANIRPGIDTAVTGVAEGRLIYPGAYMVFTENPAHIAERYSVAAVEALVGNELPPLADDAGNVTLYRSRGGLMMLDSFDYQEDYHHPLLSIKDGVSLERVNPGSPSGDPENWQSASSLVGFATPAARNSQYIDIQQVAQDNFFLPESVFSPDGDGYQDYLSVSYRMDKPGYAVKAVIFDVEGRPVKIIANSELIAAEGWLKWEGDTEPGGKAGTGIYILMAEAFHPDGTRVNFKSAFVLAGKL